jgi:hypothetical protein
VPEAYSQPYREAGLSEKLSAYYGMIRNLDENLGRLLDRVDQLGLGQNTAVIFLSDRGTSAGDERSGSHARRAPCFIRWPARLKGGRDIPQIAAHIDLLPTVLDFCDVPYPREIELDGKSLVPLLVGVEDWYRRTLILQSHQAQKPIKWRQSYVVSDRYSLVDGTALFDAEKDPFQRYNVAGRHREVYDRLRADYEHWWQEVSEQFDQPCRIPIGVAEANPTTLTCYDWHASQVPWHQRHVAKRVAVNGSWAVEVTRPGRYRFTLRDRPAGVKAPLAASAARVQIGDRKADTRVASGATSAAVALDLPAGNAMLKTVLLDRTGPTRGAYYVDVAYLGPSQKKPEPTTTPSPQHRDPARPPSAYD